MSIAWHIFAVLWIIASLYFGVLYVLIGIIAIAAGPGQRSQVASWRYIPVGAAIAASGSIVFLALIDPASLTLKNAVVAFLAMGLFVALMAGIIVPVRHVPQGSAWGRLIAAVNLSPVRLVIRLLLVIAAVVAAVHAPDKTARTIDVFLAATFSALLLWELWLRWHFRDR